MRYSESGTAYTVKQCEKIDLNNRNPRWVVLPDMHKVRANFNPCLFNGYVYLCGSMLVEVFSPQTDTFLSLSFKLPKDPSCALYVQKNCLVVHTKSYITKFAAGPAGQLVLHSQVLCPTPALKWSNSLPVLDPTRSLFFLFREDRCYSFSMETGVEVQAV